jgi:uncharacterized HAD superfamily protein/hypoxanthine phosphoribosyltransferase
VRFFSATFGAGVNASHCPITRPKRHIQPERYVQCPAAKFLHIFAVSFVAYLNYKNYGDLLTDIKRNIYKIPEGINLVVGVPRSGMIPAYMIGFILNTKVCSIDEFLNDITISHGQRPIKDTVSNVLVVDDSFAFGNSMRMAKIKIRQACPEYRIAYCAVYVLSGREKEIDIWLSVLPAPRIFQWNYMNHGIIERACFDIDGVLCVDPAGEQNDDGDKYRQFIFEAKPLYIPYYRIYALVTSRLEKYRKETEAWLERHNVRYERLYMLDLPTKEERTRLNMHAKFKAEIYAKLKYAVLFYESERGQALEIARLTKKAVFCVETDELVENPNDFSVQLISNKQRFNNFIKMILRFCIPVKKWRKMLNNVYQKIKP